MRIPAPMMDMQSLQEPNQSSLIRYISVAVIWTWLVGQMIAIPIVIFFPGPSQLSNWPVGMVFPLVVFIAPYLETQILRLMLFLIRKAVGTDIRVCLACGLIFGVLHFSSPSWGVFGGWAFFIMARIFLACEVISTGRAIWVTTLAHAVGNLLSFGIMLLTN